MRTLFRLIICTFCYDISFKCWIFQNPMVFPPWFIGFYGVPTYVEPNSEEFNSNLEYYVWILPIIFHTGEFFLSSSVIAEEFNSNLEYYVWDLPFFSNWVFLKSWRILFQSGILCLRFTNFSNWIFLKTKHLIPNENYTWMVMKTRNGLRNELTLHILIQIFMINFNIMINHYLIWLELVAAAS